MASSRLVGLGIVSRVLSKAGLYRRKAAHSWSVSDEYVSRPLSQNKRASAPKRPICAPGISVDCQNAGIHANAIPAMADANAIDRKDIT